MVVGEIESELGIAASTLSHPLEKLKIEELVMTGRPLLSWPEHFIRVWLLGFGVLIRPFEAS